MSMLVRDRIIHHEPFQAIQMMLKFFNDDTVQQDKGVLLALLEDFIDKFGKDEDIIPLSQMATLYVDEGGWETEYNRICEHIQRIIKSRNSTTW